MTTNATSWKCIDQEFRVIPPEEKRARKVYDSIVTKINENKEYACKDIFDRFCRPPYGMSEDVVVLMIAVVCANLNYCLRFRCDESLTNINSWKELVVIKDKKIDIDVVKKSAFVMVDAGAVTGKYVRFFERIQSNKSISEVISLEKILANMMAVDEIPEELETQYLLARKYLDSGKKANNEWKTCIGEIDEKLEASIEESNLYDDLYEVKNADDVEMLIDNIASVLQKGIPDADRLDFEELQKNLSELLNDINEIKRVTNSRNEFKKISEDMINKYEHSEFDFEVLPIIHEVISDMENNMNVREQEWINSVLTLGDKSRKAVHKWKEKTAYLPEYLSEETIEKVKMVDKEADEIISEGKIEDVLFYFDKLDDVEKLECIQKLQNRLNR